MNIVETRCRIFNESQRCLNTPEILNLVTTGGHYVYANSSNSVVFSQPFVIFSFVRIFKRPFSKVLNEFQFLNLQVAFFEQFEHVLNLVKGGQMSDLIYIEDFKPQASKNFKKLQTFLSKDQKTSKRIYYTKWAKEFIQKNNFKVQNFSKQSCFKLLDQKKQQAIRYQMRKQQSSTDKPKLNSRFNISFKLLSKSRGVLDIKLASFLMIPTLITEYIVLTLSYLFYLNLGFSISISILAALCVELFFMMASGSNKVLLQSLRWVIFAYSAFTVCHSTYVSDPKIQLLQNSSNTSLQHLEFQLKKQIDHSKTLKRRQEGLFADMEIYRKNELVTKGRGQLAKEKLQLARELLQNEKKIEEISSRIATINTAQINRDIFSEESLKVVEVRTWSVMVFLVLIQLLSSICANEFFNSYRDYKRKKRTKKQYFKGDTYGLATANLELH